MFSLATMIFSKFAKMSLLQLKFRTIFLLRLNYLILFSFHLQSCLTSYQFIFNTRYSPHLVTACVSDSACMLAFCALRCHSLFFICLILSRWASILYITKTTQRSATKHDTRALDGLLALPSTAGEEFLRPSQIWIRPYITKVFI